MKIYIKNMVCQGTEYCVQLELRKLGIRYSKFESGEIEFEKELSSSEMKSLYDSLSKYGLELYNRLNYSTSSDMFNHMEKSDKTTHSDMK